MTECDLVTVGQDGAGDAPAVDERAVRRGAVDGGAMDRIGRDICDPSAAADGIQKRTVFANVIVWIIQLRSKYE